MAALLTIATTMAFSGARFAQGSSDPRNVFSAGSFRVVNSADGVYVLSASALRPGQAATGTLTLTCQGDLSGAVTITNGGVTNVPSSPALSAAVTLQIDDVTGAAQTLWTGSLAGFTTLSLGQFAAGEARSLRFTVSFPQAQAVPGLQGATTTMALTITGMAR